MKKLWSLALFATIALFNACQKETQEVTDDLLTQDIAFASNKVQVQPSTLPLAVTSYVEENHFETFIETAYSVKDKGFEVILGNEEVVYAGPDGHVLHPRRGPFSHGPCGRGERIGVDELPAPIVQHITSHFPNATIQGAKLVTTDEGGLYFVKIDHPHQILIFKENREFVEATVVFFHCRPLGMRVDITTLPNAITSYIATHFPNAEIKVAFKKHNGMYIVGIFTPVGRKIVGFDADEDFLWVRP